MTMVTICLLSVSSIFLLTALISKHIGLCSVLYYLEKHKYEMPSDRELAECREWVVRQMFKKFH